jgi:hypothetical protein
MSKAISDYFTRSGWTADLPPSSNYKYPTTSWGPTPVPVDEDIERTERLRQHWFTPELLYSVWPQNYQPPWKLAEMNVEETAIWLEMIASFKGWKEGRAYAESFKTNDVGGQVLCFLTAQALKYELDISKFGHRLEIIAAIKNSELTLTNPFIVAIRPTDSRICTRMPKASRKPETFSSNSIWGKNQKYEMHHSHSTKADNRLSTKLSGARSFKKCGMIKSRGMKSQEVCEHDSDFCCLKAKAKAETGVWIKKINFCQKIEKGYYTKSCRVFQSRSDSEYSWIPTIKLPPAVHKLGESYVNSGHDATGEVKPGTSGANLLESKFWKCSISK